MFRKDINGLRAIAVLLVVLYHVGTPRISGGFVGVDIFFVISGFLMTRIIVTSFELHHFSYVMFIWSRFKRIVPALAFMICIVLLGGWFFVEPVEYAQMAAASAASLAFYSNILYLLQSSYFASASEQNWLLHTWSLSIEWQFYLLYPAFLILILRFRDGRFLMPLLCAATFLSFSACVWVSSLRASWGFYMLPCRAWELTAGGIVYLSPIRIIRAPIRFALLEFAGLVLVAASALLFAPQLIWPSFWAALPVIGAMAILIADCGDNSLLIGNPLQLIGRISYSIYIWHWPIIVAFRYFGLFVSWWAAPTAILLSLVLGWISFTFVEGPTEHLLRGFKASRQRAASVCAPATLVFIALSIAGTGGVPARAYGDRVVADSINARMEWGFPTKECEGFRADGSIKTCHAGGSISPGTLLIGDSEAQEWYPRYSNRSMGIYAQSSVTFATRAGCMPLPMFDRAEPGHLCGAFANKAFALAESGNFARVVLIAAWDEYLMDPASHQRAHAMCIQKTSGCLSEEDHKKLLSDVAKALETQLDRLRSRGIPVVIVLPLPVPGFNLPQTMARQAFSHKRALDHMALSVADYFAESRESREVLSDVAGMTGALIIDPVDFMCDANFCALLDENGMSLYKDAVHLRPSAVRARFGFLDSFMGR
jgi:peptidoglycan/LPS O-acetylase OafA/YrhL